jgi:hypothetical protein
MANGLARSDRLSRDDLVWWRTNNDWFDTAYTDPSTIDPTIFDKSIHPHTSCWFKESARRLLDRVPGYLALLDRYGVAWVEQRCHDSGNIIYEDFDQVVVTPHEPTREQSIEILATARTSAAASR